MGKTNLQKLLENTSNDFLAEVVGDFICDKRMHNDTCYKCAFFEFDECEAKFKAWLKQEAEG